MTAANGPTGQLRVRRGLPTRGAPSMNPPRRHGSPTGRPAEYAMNFGGTPVRRASEMGGPGPCGLGLRPR